jgi:hypothetical protein
MQSSKLLSVLLERASLAALRKPGWMQLLELQASKLATAADPAAADAVRKLQHTLQQRLAQSSGEQVVSNEQLEVVQAALAGCSEARKVLHHKLNDNTCRKALLQHPLALVAILQEQPWLHAQQQQQPKQQHGGDVCQPQVTIKQQQGTTYVVECSMLCRLIKQEQQEADVSLACQNLPAYLQQLLLGPTAVAVAVVSTDGSASPAAASEPAAAVAAFLKWLLRFAQKPSMANAAWFVLEHVAATAPLLVIAALQQGQTANGPQPLFARLVLANTSNSKSCISLLFRGAATQQEQLQQLVTALLQFATVGTVIHQSSSSSSSAGKQQGKGAALAQAAGEALGNVLMYSGKQSAVAEAVAAVLAQEAQAEQLLQALQQTVLHAAGSDDRLRCFALVLRGVCDHAHKAMQPQLAAFLQELMQIVLEQGSDRAATALAVLFDSKAV